MSTAEQFVLGSRSRAAGGTAARARGCSSRARSRGTPVTAEVLPPAGGGVKTPLASIKELGPLTHAMVVAEQEAFVAADLYQHHQEDYWQRLATAGSWEEGAAAVAQRLRALTGRPRNWPPLLAAKERQEAARGRCLKAREGLKEAWEGLLRASGLDEQSLREELLAHGAKSSHSSGRVLARKLILRQGAPDVQEAVEGYLSQTAGLLSGQCVSWEELRGRCAALAQRLNAPVMLVMGWALADFEELLGSITSAHLEEAAEALKLWHAQARTLAQPPAPLELTAIEALAEVLSGNPTGITVPPQPADGQPASQPPPERAPAPAPAGTASSGQGVQAPLAAEASAGAVGAELTCLALGLIEADRAVNDAYSAYRALRAERRSQGFSGALGGQGPHAAEPAVHERSQACREDPLAGARARLWGCKAHLRVKINEALTALELPQGASSASQVRRALHDAAATVAGLAARLVVEQVTYYLLKGWRGFKAAPKGERSGRLNAVMSICQHAGLELRLEPALIFKLLVESTPRGADRQTEAGIEVLKSRHPLTARAATLARALHAAALQGNPESYPAAPAPSCAPTPARGRLRLVSP